MGPVATITDKSNIQIGLLVVLLGITGTWMYRSGGQAQQLDELVRTTDRIEIAVQGNTGANVATSMRVGRLEAQQESMMDWRRTIDEWRSEMDSRMRKHEMNAPK